MCRRFGTLFTVIGLLVHTTSEGGTDSVPKRRHINSDAGESPKRKKTTFTTWREFQIKKGEACEIEAREM